MVLQAGCGFGAHGLSVEQSLPVKEFTYFDSEYLNVIHDSYYNLLQKHS